MATRVAFILGLVLGVLPQHACAPAGADRSADVVVVHFGDSTCITDYLPEAERVDVVLNARLAERYRGQRIASRNVCANGDFIRQLLAPRRALGGLLTRRSRYERDVTGRLPRIDIALIRYGQNDMKRSTPAEFRRELEALCDRLRADYPGIHLVLETNTFMDPRHGGRERDNANNDVYWQEVRSLARERGYPLVDHYARRQREIAAGNWDFYIRSWKLSKKHYSRLIVDGSRDAEMAGERKWFGNRHPNPNAVKVTADEEFRVLTATWPERLPQAGAG